MFRLIFILKSLFDAWVGLRETKNDRSPSIERTRRGGNSRESLEQTTNLFPAKLESESAVKSERKQRDIKLEEDKFIRINIT